MLKPGAMGANTAVEFGQEVEVHNLLVIDQHTFEGEVTDKLWHISHSCHVNINNEYQEFMIKLKKKTLLPYGPIDCRLSAKLVACCVLRGSLQPYSRVSRLELILFLPTAPQL
jgi:hypothetical protein